MPAEHATIPLQNLGAGHRDVERQGRPLSRPGSIQSGRDTPPPEYKEEDMQEPLPPYMERVRRVMRREMPISRAMPKKRTCLLLTILILLVGGVIVGISATTPYR